MKIKQHSYSGTLLSLIGESGMAAMARASLNLGGTSLLSTGHEYSGQRSPCPHSCFFLFCMTVLRLGKNTSKSKLKTKTSWETPEIKCSSALLSPLVFTPQSKAQKLCQHQPCVLFSQHFDRSCSKYGDLNGPHGILS